MKKVKRALALALALSTVMVSACGSTTDSVSNEPEKKTDTTENVAAENGDKVELRFLLWGNQEEIDKKTEWTEKFNEENDRIHVSLEAIPEGFHDKLTVQISSGTLADLVQIAGDFGGVYFKEGLFEPLDSYIEKDGLQDAWVDTLMTGLSYNGSVYAAPCTYNSGYIIYNKTMFEENNVPLPTDDWTEEDFLAAAQALTQGEGDDKVWGADFTSWWAYSLARNLYDGYKAWDWEEGKMTADTEGFRDGLQFMSDLYQKYKVSPTPTQAADIGGSFTTGKYAMTIGASWDMASFNEAIGDSFEWDIVTFPSNEKYGQWRSPLWTTAIGISADCPYKDEAWEYIKYMSASDEIQDQIEVIGLPALKSVSESDDFINNIPDGWKPFHKEVYAKALNYAVDGVVLNEIQDGIMKPELEKLFTGQQDIDTTIENIQTEGQLKLDRMQEE